MHKLYSSLTNVCSAILVYSLQYRGEEGKVRHRVEHVLNKDQIKHIKRAGKWPQGFSDDAAQHAMPSAADASSPTAETAQTTAEHDIVADSADTPHQQQQRQPREAVSAHDASTAAAANGKHAAAAGAQNECSDSDGEHEDSDTDSMDDLFVNTNRVAMMNLRTDYNSAESDDEEEDDDADDDDAGDVDETAAAEQQQP
jgi:hypothetical protein